MNNLKRGALGIEWTIVLIVAILVLVLFAFSFSGSINLFQSNTKSYAQSNVQSQVQACQIACSAGESGKYTYCSLPRKVNFGHDAPGSDDGSYTGSCNELAAKFSSSGFPSCQGFCGGSN